eukprot:scaffold120720_cov51-Prasinocladus_malaysianus.AAC.4
MSAQVHANIDEDFDSYGVFIGVSRTEYDTLAFSRSSSHVEAAGATGNHLSVCSGRIAYSFALGGPALSIDTACSSTLVSVSMAFSDLQSGMLKSALAGGANLCLDALWNASLGMSGMLSADSRCKSFDALADGYVRGEASGVFMLSASKVSENSSIASLKAAAVNQDGRSSRENETDGSRRLDVKKYLIPAFIDSLCLKLHDFSGTAQKRLVIHTVAAMSSPWRPVLWCGHFTGTSLGDPIEVQAIVAACTDSTEPAALPGLASDKSNLGHAEAAAGVCGLATMLDAIRGHRVHSVPHLRTVNPMLHSCAPGGHGLVGFQLPRQQLSSPHAAQFCVHSSSFGFSGTNAHVIASGQQALSCNAALDQTYSSWDLCRYWASPLFCFPTVLSGISVTIHHHDMSLRLAAPDPSLGRQLLIKASICEGILTRERGQSFFA